MKFEHQTDTPMTCEYDPMQKRLTVRGALEFPDEVFEYSDELEILDMSGNSLSELPEELSRFKKLRIAFFSGNQFREVPTVLGDCEGLELIGLKSCGIESIAENALPIGLRGLILTDNKLTQLPDWIGKYTQLQKLMLTGNQLTTLPDTFVHLRKLELLRVCGNQLSEMPQWPVQLPSLAWYADSDNPFNSAVAPTIVQTATVDYGDMTIGTKIGESSKNVVFAADLADGTPVAVKLFGEGVTTDGMPDNDIATSLLAGSHPNLIGGLGRLVGHPSGQPGLIMPLIDHEYTTLGFAPDFVTLTRDLYPSNTYYEPNAILNIAQGIASALAHLHSKGVAHGDVYAHNILVTQAGDAILCDMGAASIYIPDDPNQRWREQLDVLGYGRLVDELLAKVSSEQNGPLLQELRQISDACSDETATQRPPFSVVTSRLHALAAT